MTTTRTRSRGRKDSRSSAAREGAERRPVILASAAVVVILLIFASVATPAGHVVVAATQHFLLKFGGVFALIALTGSVGMGLIATDRIIMTPGHRVLLQAVHRAMSFAALAFLIIHIVLEITAKQLQESPTLHVHVLDAFMPFLSQYRTFYMALGTIASDLIVLLVATSIVRRRFTASGNAWKWRAIHYSSYAALILGVMHGLLAGRKAVGTYVYWSYGAVIALIALGVAVRFLATSLRSKDMVAGAAPTSDRGATGPMQSMQVRAAALGLMGQIGGTMPFGTPTQIGGDARTMAALQAADPGPPVSFPPQYGMAAEPPQAIAAAPDPSGAGRMPRYEPGYDGPPRYEGAPPRQPDYRTGPQPAVERTGPQPVYPPVNRTGPRPAYRPDAGYRPDSRHGQDPGGYGPDPGYAPDAGHGPDARYAQGRPYADDPGYRTDPGYGVPVGYGPEARYRGDAGYGPGAGYGPDSGYGPDAGYGPGTGYGPDPRFEQGRPYGDDAGYWAEPGYGAQPGYDAAPRRPRAGYDGRPPSGRGGGPDRAQPGRVGRPRPAVRPDEQTGPIPHVPSYGGDERR